MKVGFALLNSVTIKQGVGGEAAPSTESALFSGCFKVTNVFCWIVSDTCRKEKARKSKEVSGGRTGWEAMSELGHCRTPPMGGDLGAHQAPQLHWGRVLPIWVVFIPPRTHANI